ncbi:MAG: LysR family transcriptional regulator, partial [Pollutimonas bauzanensis]
MPIPILTDTAMELRHLRYFRMLAEHLNFTRAAERLYITQSTLSHQIKQLEEEIGLELVTRKGKTIALTHAGQHFLASATRAVEGIDNTLRELKSFQQPLTGHLVIGATHTFSIKLLGQYLALFVKQFPLVKLELLELP